MRNEFKQLRGLYGKSPEKGVTAEEMAARVEALTAQMGEILDECGHELKHLRNSGAGSDLEALANVPDIYRKRAGGQYIDAWTNLLDRNFEWLERKWKEDEIKRRSAKEWRELERAYIVKSRYTLWDFYDDFKTLIENGEADWNDYRTERKKWRICKHRFCLEIFPVKSGHFKEDDRYFGKRRSDARFCCSGCRKGEYESKQQFIKTGKVYDNPTYLPPDEINAEMELDISKIERAELHEVSSDSEEELDAYKMRTLKHTDFKDEATRELKMRSKDVDRRARYEAFIRGEGEGMMTVKISGKENKNNSEIYPNKRSDHRYINEKKKSA